MEFNEETLFSFKACPTKRRGAKTSGQWGIEKGARGKIRVVAREGEALFEGGGKVKGGDRRAPWTF